MPRNAHLTSLETRIVGVPSAGRSGVVPGLELGNGSGVSVGLAPEPDFRQGCSQGHNALVPQLKENKMSGQVLEAPVSARFHASGQQDRRTARQDGVVCVNRLRVRATVQNIDGQWAEVKLSVKVGEGWFPLEGGKLRVARRRSGQREAQELYVISALRRSLSAHGVAVLSLDGSEQRVGDGVTDYRYWASMGSRLTYALEVSEAGVVSVVNLP
ncbi:hypothetical protein PBI_OATS_62 [Microbacterium phage Oats]|uniref:Uncharacterized protein n=1 Tax=Microbacterium phage Oats TaxID=2182356 RepID=A0A2U8UJQ2_9CAUD|nr:hypothetical protein PBI_OATS_62 [Microbacterium phage Oats]